MHRIQEQTAPIQTAEDTSEIILLVSTSKGGFVYYSDHKRRIWEVNGPYLLGSIVHHMILDPRDGKTILMAAQTKAHGPTIFKSSDFGMTWIPAEETPQFDNGKKLAHIFRLCPGHTSEPGVWYAGSSPQGLFKSEDGGNIWEPVVGFNKHPHRDRWWDKEGTHSVKYQKVHSLFVNPVNAKHLTVGMSSGGVYESQDEGENWIELNNGIDHEAGFEHLPGKDPHCLVQHPMDPSRLYQQNQSGVFRQDRQESIWRHIGADIDVGDIGFSLCVHPRDPDTLWIFPMEGTDIWSRVCSGGQPAVYCSKDGGKAWFRQDIGFPMWHAWFTVVNKAMTTDHFESVGLYMGTTNGSIWLSDNEGNSWRQIVNHLPKIYALEVGYTQKD